MSYESGNLFEELTRLAETSHRARLYLSMILNSGERRPTAEMKDTLRRMVKDLRMERGEFVSPSIYWPHDRIPETITEAQVFLQRPEVLDTENYKKMLMHADMGKPDRLPGVLRKTYVSEEIRIFTRQLIKLAQDRKVPLFVELCFVRREVQARAFSEGLTPIRPEQSPYCHGNAALIGHAAETRWHPACVRWLVALAELASLETGVAIGYDASRPAEFIAADANGVLLDESRPLPDPHGDPEVDELAAEYGWRRPGPLPDAGKAMSADDLAAFYGISSDEWRRLVRDYGANAAERLFQPYPGPVQ